MNNLFSQMSLKKRIKLQDVWDAKNCVETIGRALNDVEVILKKEEEVTEANNMVAIKVSYKSDGEPVGFVRDTKWHEPGRVLVAKESNEAKRFRTEKLAQKFLEKYISGTNVTDSYDYAIINLD